MGFAKLTKRRAAPGTVSAAEAEKNRAIRLCTQAIQMAKADDHGQAIELFQKAADIQRTLLPDAPKADQYLTVILWNMAVSLRKIGQEREALAAAREATPLASKWAATASAGDDLGRNLLIMTLLEVAKGMEAVGTQEERIDTSLEAARILRECDYERNEKYRLQAAFLDTASNYLIKLGRSKEALPVLQEAIEIHRILVARGSTDRRVELAVELGRLAVLQAESDQVDAAIESAMECRTLVTAPGFSTKASNRRSIASNLRIVGSNLSRLDHLRDAIEWHELAIDLQRRLLVEEPGRGPRTLAAHLNDYAWDLGLLGRTQDALASARESVDLHRAGPAETDEQRRFLAGALDTLATQLATLGRPEEALALCREAIAIIHALPQRDSDEHRAHLEHYEQHLAKLEGR